MLSEHLCEPYVKAALKEGWQLVDTQRRGHHVLEIQCVDDPDRMSEEMQVPVMHLESDEQAVQKMRASFEAGNDHALEAYRIVKKHSPAEFEFWGMHTWRKTSP